MAYEKQEWNCGDTITAEKMNHIEDGIANASQGGGGGGKVYAHTTISEEGNCTIYTLDITGEDVKTILENGQDLIIIDDFNNYCRPIKMFASGVTENAKGPVATYAIVDIIFEDRDGVHVRSFSASSSSDYLTYRQCDGV